MLKIDWRIGESWQSVQPVTRGNLIVRDMDWRKSARGQASGQVTLIVPFAPTIAVIAKWHGRMIGDWPEAGYLAAGQPVIVYEQGGE
jgi:hypothetical protein